MALALGGIGLSAGAIAGGAVLAAVTGALGLALVGAARRRFRGRRFGRRRFGREADDEQAALNSLLEMVRAEDITDCGKRLMCELAAVPEDSLPQVGHDILNLVGPVTKPGEGVLPQSASEEYLDAKKHGYFGGSCELKYSACHQSGEQIMNTVMGLLG